MKLAEDAGFTYGWIPDSHIIWGECYSYMAYCAAKTDTIKIGPMVTTPTTRHPTVVASGMSTLDEISGGRAVMGIGRGDSAARTLGINPVKVADFQKSVDKMQKLCRGDKADYLGTDVQFPWREGCKDSVPVYVAAYGPKVLEYAGEHADGVILQIASPAVIKWCIEHIRKGAEKAGRSMKEIDVVAAAFCYVGEDREYGLDLCRPFPAVVSNHIKDVLKKFPREELPEELVEVVDLIKDYNYKNHGKPGAAHAANIPDEMVIDYTIFGTAEECKQKVELLKEIGVTQVALYHTAEELGMPDKVAKGNIKAFGEFIIPHVS